jgi:hypothetical protein
VQRARLELDLAGADVVLDQRRQRLLRGGGADRALEVDVLGQGERRVGIAEHAVALRDPVEQRHRGDRRGRRGRRAARRGDGSGNRDGDDRETGGGEEARDAGAPRRRGGLGLLGGDAGGAPLLAQLALGGMGMRGHVDSW